MANPNPTFIITRDDQVIDPITLFTQALTVGRQIDCDILLNHPSVSRLHAGINEVDGRFYLINLSSSNPVTLNGRLVEFNVAEAVADGDVAQIGSFSLQMSRHGTSLNVHVRYQVAVNVAEAGEDAKEEHPLAIESTTASPQVADALKEFWNKRSRNRATRPTPLHPRRPTRPGKAQFNWTPTRDLLRPWRSSVFIWALIVIGLVSVTAAFWYTSAFSPDAISKPHTQASLVFKTSAGGLAKEPNSNSCTTCHSISGSMETNCASCHQTAAFSATLSGIQAHADAGIGCVACHTEHQGADFRPAVAAKAKCVECHRDDNKNLYRGRRVFTPHGGTVGYPVVGGKWTWEGPSEEAWSHKPDNTREALKQARQRLPNETDDKWRSRQFHTLHLYRVLVHDVGLPGNADGEMSCSSCHKSFEPLDVTTPASTCAKCHNVTERTQDGPSIASADCTSCHIQHIKDFDHWNSQLLSPKARGVDK